MSDKKAERKEKKRSKVAKDQVVSAEEPIQDEQPPASGSTPDDKAEKRSKKRSRATEESDANPPTETTKDDVAMKERDEPKEEQEEEEEVPAMSHKERRLAKRRKLLSESTNTPSDSSPLPNTLDSDRTTGGPKFGQTPSRSAHGVWIGNLSFKTTTQVLLSWLKEKGGLGEVTRIHMPGGKKPGEQNIGFAYVDFASGAEVTIAVSLSEQHLDGRKLLIKSSSDYTGRPTPTLPTEIDGAPTSLNKTQKRILGKQKNLPGPTLFVGNLGFEMTVDDVRDLIERHDEGRGKEEESGSDSEGEEKESRRRKTTEVKVPQGAGIRKVRLGTFEDSGKCKGWAFIDFLTPADATRALLNPRNHTLNGRSLNMEYGSAEAVRRGQLGTRAAVSAAKRSGVKPGGKRERYDEEDVDRRDEGDHGSREDGYDESRRGKEGKSRVKKMKKEENGGRAKPGAALASAQRASEAIVPSRGKKITF